MLIDQRLVLEADIIETGFCRIMWHESVTFLLAALKHVISFESGAGLDITPLTFERYVIQKAPEIAELERKLEHLVILVLTTLRNDLIYDVADGLILASCQRFIIGAMISYRGCIE